MCIRDRYEAGNKHALAVVRVPEVEQEQRRLITRQRESFVRQVRRFGAMGRSHGMSQGHEISNHWWRKGAWSALSKRLPQHLKDLLEPLSQLLLKLEEFIKQRTEQIKALATAAAKRPKGLGALTERIIENEVLDWSRFSNRRQVSSYTGLCPSEHSSGGKRRQGSVNKHGNPRLRHALVECVWRFIRLQPGWKRLLKVVERLKKGKGAGRGAVERKKTAVALARELSVDLWRLNTGRTTLAVSYTHLDVYKRQGQRLPQRQSGLQRQQHRRHERREKIRQAGHPRLLRRLVPAMSGHET